MSLLVDVVAKQDRRRFAKAAIAFPVSRPASWVAHMSCGHPCCVAILSKVARKCSTLSCGAGFCRVGFGSFTLLSPALALTSSAARLQSPTCAESSPLVDSLLVHDRPHHAGHRRIGLLSLMNVTFLDPTAVTKCNEAGQYRRMAVEVWRYLKTRSNH